MTHHLTTLQVKQLCVSASPEDELAAAAVHTAACHSCHQRFIHELKRQRGSIPFNFTLAPQLWFRNDHLDFDQLIRLAENAFDEETLEIINIHLSVCETCREDVRSFLAFRDATAREMNISNSPAYFKHRYDIPSAAWWRRLQTKPIYAVAAMVLLAIAIISGAFALFRKSEVLEANRHDQLTPYIGSSPSSSPSLAPTVDDSAKVAVLKDRGGEVTIDESGRVTGLDEVSENARQHVARAALSEQLEPADLLTRLSGEQSGLRGDDNGPEGFRLLYPVRRLVTEDRPIFRWETLPGVSSYRVYVLDEDGNQVSQSEELPPNQSRWKAPARLRRGQIFSWVVTALADGKKVFSPSASAPEVKFAVLSTADFRDLSRLKKSNSHLALGVFYARTGLLNEAEREFDSLIKLNPQAELPRKLLHKVRTMRKAD